MPAAASSAEESVVAICGGGLTTEMGGSDAWGSADAECWTVCAPFALANVAGAEDFACLVDMTNPTRTRMPHRPIKPHKNNFREGGAAGSSSSWIRES